MSEPLKPMLGQLELRDVAGVKTQTTETPETAVLVCLGG